MTNRPAFALSRVAVLALAMAPLLTDAGGVTPADAVPALSSAAVVSHARPGAAVYEGVVEAVRQTVVAAQVPGAVIALQVRAGDTVRAGQVLLRLDARAAEQTAVAGAAQARAAQAAMDVATRDFERQQQLYAQSFISRAALDQAEARFRTSQAGASAQLASAGAARTQSDFYVVKAPYAGVIASVSVVLGDMAMPGRPLLTLYDPAALRVTAAIPQTAAARLGGPLAPQVDIPGAAAAAIRPVQVQLLPTVDAASHTLELRMDLPPDMRVVPGMFARVSLPGTGATGGEARLFVPLQALVRRAELAAVYVIGADGKPLLRQVRPGRSDGGRVEILSGVAAGESVALDPQAAARIR